jgi:hypothetical protein
MNRILMIFALLVIVLSAAHAESFDAETPSTGNSATDTKVMVCSACPGDMYIRITDDYDDSIMETEAIPQYAASRMFSTTDTGIYYLSYKENEDDDWEFYLDENDDDFEVELIPGKVCCIVIDAGLH